MTSEERAWLATRLPDLLADLEALVGCESPSADLAAVRRSADLIAAVGSRRLGVAPEMVEVDGCSHLRWRFGAGPNRVLILAHHDTVWPIGTLLTHPWSIRGNVIRGPGTVDMKAGLLQAIYAIAALIEQGEPVDGICLLVTGDEEIGSPTSRALIEDEARGCAACFVLEGAGPGRSLKTGRKGTSGYRIEITGRAAHAGAEPEKGINAGVELAHLILTIAGMGVPEVGTTVTPTVAGAGTTTNTVPAAAYLLVDVRARTRQEQDRVHRSMLELAPTLPGAVLTVLGEPNRPPMEVTSGAALFERARAIGLRDGLGELRQSSVGGGSDGNFTAGIGVPTLDGLGAVGGGAHADNEHILLDELLPRTGLLVGLIREVLADKAVDPGAPSSHRRRAEPPGNCCATRRPPPPRPRIGPGWRFGRSSRWNTCRRPARCCPGSGTFGHRPRSTCSRTCYGCSVTAATTLPARTGQGARSWSARAWRSSSSRSGRRCTRTSPGCWASATGSVPR
jgi:glutamate carboxypeptidase